MAHMVLDWLVKYWGVLLFYVGVIGLVYYNRAKFEFEGRFVALYKTKWGIDLMKRFAESYPRLVHWFGVSGIYFGFFGMFLTLVMVSFAIYMLISNPTGPAVFQPVIPGFEMPGGIRIPLIQGLLALFVVVIIHEFAHGIICKLEKIKVKSSGFAMIGPLPAAFVEPDEKKLAKAGAKKQLAMFAAGPWSNFIQAILVLGLLVLAGFASAAVYDNEGVEITGFNESDSRFDGFEEGMIITGFNNVAVADFTDLRIALNDRSPGEIVNVTVDGVSRELELVPSNINESVGVMGISIAPIVTSSNAFLDAIQPAVFWLIGNVHTMSFEESTIGVIMFKVLGGFGFEVFGLLDWIFHLALGVGLVNLLPLGPVDGGRMLYVSLEKFFGEKRATKVWYNVSMGLFGIVLLLIFAPILISLFG